ncbi:MAG: flavodoxin family protein [Firmicutes bacterium]|nr:flavodoxin family protein [Bacillota bacterium]
MLIIGLNGSPNRKANTAYILEAALDAAAQLGAKTETLFLRGIVEEQKNPFCIACETPCQGRCYKGTELENALEKIASADGLLLASPVYFGSVSAQIKAFWDKTRRLRRSKRLLNTVGGGLSVGAARFGGQETTLRALHSMMLVQGMILVGDSHEKSAGHHGTCVGGAAEEDQNALKRAFMLGQRVAQVCKATASLRADRPGG